MSCQYYFKDRYGNEHRCQFPLDETCIYENGEEWCYYHLPLGLGKSGWSESRKNIFNESVTLLVSNAIKNEEKLVMTGVVFPKKAAFEKLNISDASFIDASFCEDVSFSNTEFIVAVSFEGGKFLGKASFYFTTFGDGGGDFRDAVFHDEAQFCGAKFKGLAEYDGSIFKGESDFDLAYFGSTAWFSNTEFHHKTTYGGAIFTSNAEFNDSIFYEDCNFEGGRNLSKDNDVGNDCFNRIVIFDNSLFLGEHKKVSFSNRNFKEDTSFKNCIFHSPPLFHNSILHQYTNFRGAKFKDVKSSDSDMAYRTLKLAMESNRARNEQAMFYALEQRSLCHQSDTPIWAKTLSKIYALLSDYGQSMFRPLIALLCVLFSSYIIFSLYYEPSTSEGKYSNVAIYTITQTIRPFDSWTKSGSENIELMFSYRDRHKVMIYSAIHSILVIILVSLFILSVRWRFKRD